MNYFRLLFGGLLAGIVLVVGETAFIAVLGARIAAARETAGMHPFVPQPVLGLLEIFLTGLALVWLYAAIRSRYGAGIGTALRAACAGWFGLVFLGTLHTIWEDLGFPPGLLLTVAFAFLPVFVLATIAGAWVYREQEIR